MWRIVLLFLFAPAVVVSGCGSSSSTTTTTTTVPATPATTATAAATPAPTTTARATLATTAAAAAAPAPTTTAPATTATAAAPPPQTTTSSEAGTSSPSFLDAVPVYQPSSTIRRAPHSLIIDSPESLTKVGSYYSSTFAGGGWVTVSKSVTRRNAGFTVKKGSHRATVVVFPKGSGSTVAISTPRCCG